MNIKSQNIIQQNQINISNLNLTSCSEFEHDFIILINQFCLERNISLPALLISVFEIMIANYQFEPELLPVKVEIIESDKNSIKQIDLTLTGSNNQDVFEIIQNVENKLLKYNIENKKIFFDNYEQSRQINISLINDSNQSGYDLKQIIKLNGKIEFEFFAASNSKYHLTAKHSPEHFENILSELIKFPNTSTNDFNLASDEENKLIDRYCSGSYFPELAEPACLSELFEKTAKVFPDNIAIVYLNQSITYKQLNEKANSLAGFLKSKLPGSNNFIGLLLNRSIDLYIGMLAILKSGNTYVPIDPSYPSERIEYILNDCNAGLLLTSSGLDKKSKNIQSQIINLDLHKVFFEKYPSDNLTKEESKAIPENLAYSIYTSGTTGMPKGVKISNKSASNLVRSEGKLYNVNQHDKVLQGFSTAFDASIEEIWMAFYSGATLVIATEEIMKSGQEITKFLNVNKISVFSTVPTLLSVLEDEIPTLRILILGGEVCTKELVNRWSKDGRQIFNTYGPTEATVIATFSECHPGQEVTIGKPVTNYSVYILNSDKKLRPIGIPGEIHIGGLSLSDGYINRDELNKTKFIEPSFEINPNFPKRLYSTGDLGRLNQYGDIEYLGRIDTQVKIRGYRVELSEIESQLILSPGVQSAAIAVKNGFNGIQNLVAYIIPAKNHQFDESEVKKLIKAKLPSYMIPSIFQIVEEFPKLPSGKIDRKNLPEPDNNTTSDIIDTGTYSKTEKKLVDVWKRLFSLNIIDLNDDFFDLGGHSLFASQMISELRKDESMNKLSVKDIYSYPTIRLLSSFIDSMNKKTVFDESKSKERVKKVSKMEYITVAALQAVSLMFFYLLTSSFLMLPILLEKIYQFNDIIFCTITIGIFVSAMPVLILLSIAMKWLIIGKFKEGSYPLWGFYYFRFWFVKKLIDFVPLSLFSGSPVLTLYYKLMGAKIGKHVFSGSDRMRAFDVVSIGDNTSISKETHVMGYSIENSTLHIGKITIGKHCYLGPRSLMSLNSEMKDNSSLMELSMLPANMTIPTGEIWKGSPAKLDSIRENHTEAGFNNQSSHVYKELVRSQLPDFVIDILQILAVIAVIAFPLIIALPMADYLFELEEKIGLGYSLLLSIPSAGIYVIMFCLVVAGMKWILLGKQIPADIPVNSLRYIRKWIVDTLLQLNLLMLKSIYATIFLPYWFRMMGAKIGKQAEISTVNQISIDLLEIGEGSFIADSANVGAPLVFNSVMRLRKTKVGKRSFVGNSAVLATGSTVPDNSLIGVLSVPPDNVKGKNLDNTSWLGSPPMFLPKRQESEKFSEELTYHPTKKLIFLRGFIELFKISLPYAFEICFFGMFYWLVFYFSSLTDIIQTLTVSMCIFGGLSILSPILAYIPKKILVDKFTKQQKPLWSTFVWRNELVNSICENFIYPLYQNFMLGTPFAPFFFRLMGSKIGKRVYMETTEITEFDLVNIGDDSALNFGCTIQTHLFEDRVMKMSHINIGKNCTVGPISVVLYDTEMGDSSSIEGLSLLMKGETLPPGTIWQGSPVKYSRNQEIEN